MELFTLLGDDFIVLFHDIHLDTPKFKSEWYFLSLVEKSHNPTVNGKIYILKNQLVPVMHNLLL